jgi:type II secretion system protein I
MRSAGFTLLEVLTAVAIVAMAAQAVVWVFAEQSAGMARAQRLQLATALAESTFDRLGRDLPLRNGIQSGEAGEGLRWQLRIAPYPSAEASTLTRLYAVELAVQDLRADRELFKLDAIRMGVVAP